MTISVRKRENHKDLLTEADWSDVDICPPYDKSKFLAERAAWDFVNALPVEERFELVVVIPGLVQGPTLITGEFSSMNYMRMLLMGVMPALPKIMFPIVDVRDVAQAHLNAIKIPEARNQRFILTLRTFRFKELCEVLKAHYGEKYPIKTNEMEQCPPNNPRFEIMWDRTYNMDHTKSVEVLGIKYHDIKDTLIDMAEGLIDFGMIPDNRAK